MKKYIAAVLVLLMLCFAGVLRAEQKIEKRADTTAKISLGLPNEKEREDVCKFVASMPYKERLENYMVRYGVFDIDNDGRAEIVEHYYMGTSDPDSFIIRKKNGMETVWGAGRVQNDKENIDIWAHGAAWLSYEGRMYLVHFTEGSGYFPTYITYIDPENKAHLICTFKNEIAENILPDYSERDSKEICEALNTGDGKIQYLKDEPLSDEMKKRFWGAEYKGDEAPFINHEYIPSRQLNIDFDNDGKKENIVLFSYSSSGGRGCETHHYAFASEDGKKVTDGDKAQLLWKMQFTNPDDPSSWHQCDIGKLQWFVAGGKNILEVAPFELQEYPSRGKLFHNVFYIKDNIIHRVCRPYFVVKTNIAKVFSDEEVKDYSVSDAFYEKMINPKTQEK